MRFNLLIWTTLMFAGIASVHAHPLFTDDFERDLHQWEVVSPHDISIQDSKDGNHKNVLVLVPNGDVYALIRGSDRWKGVRMEGDVLFPRKESNYLGILYHFPKRRNRADFGNIYIKGDGSYLQPNPHYDLNVGRTLYPEYHVDLSGSSAIVIGKWQHFKVEVLQNECHFYVGDMTTPQLTFSLWKGERGLLGLQPRSVGGEVWVDNVVVHSIEQLAYTGSRRPEIRYQPESLLTQWEAVGPIEQMEDEIAKDTASQRARWRPFETDERGAVITGKITDYQGKQTVAYFRTRFQHDKEEDAVLHISTVDDLAMWLNGRFWWFIPRDENIWFDFWSNPKHAGQRIPVSLHKGENEIVLRARGGVYASGGFYARIEMGTK